MKRTVLAALAATALTISPASAFDYWNRSGFSLDHNFHSPYDNVFGRRPLGYYYAPRYQDHTPIQLNGDDLQTDRPNFEVVETSSERYLREQAAARVAKAIRDERTCAPVIIYTDEGVVRHPASGCR